MGWTVYYSLHRDDPLTDQELERLARHVAAHNELPWGGEPYDPLLAIGEPAEGVVAYGYQKIPFQGDEEHERLCDVLTELRSLLPRVECRVSDDMDAFGWDASSGRYELNATPSDGEPAFPIDDDDGSWESWRAFLPASVAALPAEVDEILRAMEAEGELSGEVYADGPAIETLLFVQRRLEWDSPQRERVALALARCQPLRVLEVGLPRLEELDTNDREPLVTALRALPDPTPVIPALLEQWRRQPPHGHWPGDLTHLLEPVASHPTIVEELCGDLWDPALDEQQDYQRHRAAVHLLGSSGSEAALRCLIARERAGRGREGLDRGQTHRALGELRRREAVATLLLSATDPLLYTTSRGFLIEALGALGDPRALPYFAHELAIDADPGSAGWALGSFAGDGANDLLEASLANDDPRIRYDAAKWLVDRRGKVATPALLSAAAGLLQDSPADDRELAVFLRKADEAFAEEVPRDPAAWPDFLAGHGLEVATPPPVPDPLDRLTAACDSTREQASANLFERRDPGYLLALALADQLDWALHEHLTGLAHGTSRDWEVFDVLPEDLHYASGEEIVKWAEAHADLIGPQHLSETLERVRSEGAHVVAESYPRWEPWTPEPELLAALEAEELGFIADFKPPQREPRPWAAGFASEGDSSADEWSDDDGKWSAEDDDDWNDDDDWSNEPQPDEAALGGDEPPPFVELVDASLTLREDDARHAFMTLEGTLQAHAVETFEPLELIVVFRDDDREELLDVVRYEPSVGPSQAPVPLRLQLRSPRFILDVTSLLEIELRWRDADGHEHWSDLATWTFDVRQALG